MNRFNKYIKSIQICIGFLFLVVFAQAQADLSYIKTTLEKKDYARAKESIDSFVESHNTSAEGWFTKSVIYTAISKESGFKYLTVDAGLEAFLYLQKAVQLDRAYITSLLKSDLYFTLPSDIYIGLTNEGLNQFNAGVERNDKNNYKAALTKFKEAGLVSRFIFSNGLGLHAIDTLNLYYTANAAISSDKEDDAELNCKIIADNKITEGNFSNNFERLYQWLAFYYKEKQDGVNFTKYAMAGMEAFPASGYYDLCFIDWYRQLKDYPNLFSQYQSLFKKDDANSKYQLQYYQDVYNYLYQSNSAIPSPQQYKSILAKGLTEYIQLNAGSTAARLLLGKYYINQARDIYKELDKRTTLNNKIKNEYQAKAANNFKKSNFFLQQIVHKFPSTEKNIYKEAVELIISNYKSLNQLKEVRKYQVLLGKATAVLYKRFILIILLFNIILIIGLLFYLVIKYRQARQSIFIISFAIYKNPKGRFHILELPLKF